MGRGLRSLSRLVALAIALTGGLAGLNAPAASADGLHLLPRVWMGGCSVEYSLDARARTQYATNIAYALAAISTNTGISFTRVDGRASSAAIRVSVVDSLPSQELGLASTLGEITLADESRLPSAHNEVLDSELRDRIVAHEVLHALGLAHDDEAWSLSPDELMNPRQRWQPLRFGDGDRTGMAYLRSANHCVSAA
jgi:hypothetical protein